MSKSPHKLWLEANGNHDRYIELMKQHGHLVPRGNLTDEEINEVAQRFPTHFGEPMVSVLVQRLVSELRERRSLDEHRRKSDDELIERRERDLTSEDVAKLRSAREIVMHSGRDVDRTIRAVLDKLLNPGGDR